MKFLTSRVIVSAIASFIAFAIVPAIATTPEADFKTVTSKAYVDSLISNNDISGHKVNGAPLSNAASYFYGEGVGAADTATKTVSIPSITGTPAVGQVIVVKPATTNTASTMKINLNNTTAYSVLYRGSANDIPKDVWTAYVPSIFVLDVSSGTKYWRYVGTSPVAMTWSATETAAANAYSTTFDGTTGNWPVADENRYVKGDSLAGALSLKQNKIDAQNTSLIIGQQVGNGIPSSVIAPTATPGVVQQVGLWDADGGDPASWDLETAYGVATERSAIRQSIPTVGAVEVGLASKQNKIPAGTSGEILTYSGTAGQLGTPWVVLSNLFGEDGDAIENYSTTFDGTDGNWTTGSAGKLITTNVLANGLALKQTILQPKNTGNFAPSGNQAVTRGGTMGSTSSAYITAGGSVGLTTRSGAPAVINYVNGTATDLAAFTSGTFGTNSTTNQNYIKGALVSLELLKDVYGELNTKITNNALPTGTAGTVVTYNGTNPQTGIQQFTETAIVDAPDYTGTGGTLVNGDSITSVEYVEDALATKQPIIQPSTVNGKTQIVVKPAYGGNAGEIGYLTLDTLFLTIGNDSTVPSSKLLNTLLSEKYDLNKIFNTGRTDTYASDYSGAPSWATTSGTANLYRIPAAVNGGNWASKVLYAWSSKQNVPTMDTLANSLAGLYDAIDSSVDSRILDYGDTTSDISSASVAIPSQIEYTGARTLGDGNQLFWLPQLANNGVQEATGLLKSYSMDKIVPSMDELAYALDGVLQTHETTREWHAVLNHYDLREMSLFDLANLINMSEEHAILLNRSGYLKTFAPSLELLMNESYELQQLIDTKQNKLSGTNGYLVTYGANAGQTGSKAIATSISNNANTVPNTAAVYNAVNARQNVIPVAGKYRSSNTTTTDTDISDWTATNIKGTALVTKPTSANGVVGERKIFEAGDTYTNDAATNIQIATIGAVMENIENTVTKRCVGYKPGTSVQNAENCWLWEFVGNSASCIATGGSCTNNSECCSGTCGVGGQCN